MCAQINLRHQLISPMASTLSLKELRTSSTLKTEISQLNADKKNLLKQIEQQKQAELEFQEKLLEHKKDFEHLENQFEHFAGIEAEHEALLQEVQMERLEKMLDGDKKENQYQASLKKSKDEISILQKELKELKVLDPVRLKRQVSDLKKKTVTQASENKTVNKALVTTRKELKEANSEKEKIEAEQKASLNQTDFFWQSTHSEWTLFETGLVLKDETVEKGDEPKRIKCTNMITGVSVVSKELDEKDIATWHGDIEIPADVSKEAGKRLKKIATEAEKDSKKK